MRDAVRRLLHWFGKRDRSVPGRREADPYRIWVAEVMAQQTRISTVLSYYDSFLARFPDVETLATAPLDDVLKEWEGLGYYGRARNLHRAAAVICERHDGRLPADPVSLRALPGIGRYTAGAISSIAFGLPEPAVDGNVRRVLCRVYDLADPPPPKLERLARQWIEFADGDAGALNQALMDLGGSVCLPRGPQCEVCPLADACLALRHGTIPLRPAKRVRPPLPHHDIAAAIIWRGPKLLIARRPEDGLLGGLWEFPGGKVEAGETPREAARREVREEMGIDVEILAPVDEVRHAYSHFRITLHLFHARWISGEPSAPPEARPSWVLPEELDRYAFPAANHAVIGRLARGEERPPRSCPGPA